MNRIERLLAIILTLQQKRRIRAADLAQQFNVSQRTIYRDIQALSELHIPITVIPGEGYELLHTYSIPPLMFTQGEAIAIVMAINTFIQQTQGDLSLDAQMVLTKLQSILTPHLKDHVQHFADRVEFLPSQHPIDWDIPHLPQIAEAIEREATIRIAYKAYKAHDITQRHVDPYYLSFANPHWYVTGYCHLRNDLRSFRVTRIQSLSVTDQTFTPRQFVPDESDLIMVIIRVNLNMLVHIQEQQHYGFIRQAGDLFIYEVDTLEEIQYWLFGFGSQIEVLSPPNLRAWMIEEAQLLIKRLT